MKSCFVIALIFNIILSLSEGSLYYMMVMVRSLALILNLPIFRIVMPANVIMVIRIAIPIVLFDILENDYDINASTIMPFDA